MTIDNTPAIKAYAVERIKGLLARLQVNHEPVADRIDELEMIIALCDGLSKQNEMLAKFERSEFEKLTSKTTNQPERKCEQAS